MGLKAAVCPCLGGAPAQAGPGVTTIGIKPVPVLAATREGKRTSLHSVTFSPVTTSGTALLIANATCNRGMVLHSPSAALCSKNWLCLTREFWTPITVYPP